MARWHDGAMARWHAFLSGHDWLLSGEECSLIHIYTLGVVQAFLSKATYNKYLVRRREKQQYIAVGTVIMFREQRAKHL